MCSIMGYCDVCAAFSEFQKGFLKTTSRGPDDSRIVDTGKGLLGFHRLSIMGLTPSGMQPFERDGSYVVCNGEIYGFEKLKKELEKKYEFVSGSDCEILLPLYFEHGVDMFRMLDAEFALILYDGRTKEYIAARDPIGIRPLYYGYDKKGVIVFASEPKNLVTLCDKIMPFPPGHYYKDGKFVCYCDIAKPETVCHDDLDTVCAKIHDKLVRGVEKRLVADAKVGFLLSGGLDSSLVCAIAARKSDAPIRTFAIGMSEDAIDLKYAKQVADYIGSEHTEVYMTKQQVLDSLEEVIRMLGTYDITTIRATSCSVINTPTLRPLPKNSRRRPKNASASFTCTTCSAPTAASVSTRSRPESRSATSTLSNTSCPSTPSGSSTNTARASICSATRLRATICRTTFSTAKRLRSPMRSAIRWWMISRNLRKSSIPTRNSRRSAGSIPTRSRSRRNRFCTARSSSAIIPASPR